MIRFAGPGTSARATPNAATSLPPGLRRGSETGGCLTHWSETASGPMHIIS
jgi:hypothetical protein